MNDMEKLEMAKVEIWKNKKYFKIYFIYNAPRNKIDLNLLEVTNKTIVIGDLNGHSRLWGYHDTNATGRVIEELLNTSRLELLFNKDQRELIYITQGLLSTQT